MGREEGMGVLINRENVFVVLTKRMDSSEMLLKYNNGEASLANAVK